VKIHQCLPALAAIVLAFVLASCTSFAPVYGSHAGSGMAAARFNFAPPGSRLEQLVINRLKLAFPAPATEADPVLDVSVSIGSPPGVRSSAFAMATPSRIRVYGVVTVAQGKTTVFEATRFVDTAYQSGKLTLAQIEISTGTQESAAISLADSIRAAILAGYRPGMLPAQSR